MGTSTKNIETIINSNERNKVDRIVAFAKSLDDTGKDALINIMIGFEMAQNLNLVGNNILEG